MTLSNEFFLMNEVVTKFISTIVLKQYFQSASTLIIIIISTLLIITVMHCYVENKLGIFSYIFSIICMYFSYFDVMFWNKELWMQYLYLVSFK